MENDDRQVGRILSRREVLALLGVAGSAALVGGGFQALTDKFVRLPLIMRSDGTVTLTPTATATSEPTGTATSQPTATATSQPTGTATSASTATATSQPTGTVTAQPAETATPVPACVVSPELTEGPYFVDERLNRSDIRTDPSDGSVRDGVLLQLTLRAFAITGNSCAPLEGAVVDIWHCDALGLYSDVAAEGTAGRKFLRGYQVTNANGTVQFTTIYPGWYRGRAVHIHFKVRTDLTANPSYEFTSQFFFDDTLTDQVHTRPPYAGKGQRDTRNNRDGIYRNGGDQLLLTLIELGDGYMAAFDIGLSME